MKPLRNDTLLASIMLANNETAVCNPVANLARLPNALNIAIHGSLWISLSRYPDEKDIERIIATLPEIVANLRRLSPYWDDRRNCLAISLFLVCSLSRQ